MLYIYYKSKSASIIEDRAEGLVVSELALVAASVSVLNTAYTVLNIFGEMAYTATINPIVPL